MVLLLKIYCANWLLERVFLSILFSSIILSSHPISSYPIFLLLNTRVMSLPVYSGKQILKGDFLIFSSNMSFLLRKRMMEVFVNHLLLQMLSNSFILSCIRFYKRRNQVLFERNFKRQSFCFVLLTLKRGLV